MTAKMPQEIEVWYVLPAIRRELAIALVKYGSCTQRTAAHLLQVTEPAVSQYLSSKRAKSVEFDNETKKLIRGAAERIAKEPGLLVQEIQRICSHIEKSNKLCSVHKQMETVPDNCTACRR